MKRRTLLTLLGATAATTAGCSTSTDSTDDQPGDTNTTTGSLDTAPSSAPGYARWLSTESAESLLIRLDFEQASAIDSYDFSEDDSSASDDLALDETFTDVSGIAEAFPAVTAIGPLFFLGFLQLGYSFVEDVAYTGGENAENPVMTADSIMLADNGLVLSGSVNEQTLQSQDSIAQVDSYAGYRIYGSSNDGKTPSPDGNSNYSPFAVSETELVFPLSEEGKNSGRTDRENLNAALDTNAAGVQTNLVALDWLLERCGDGALVLVGSGKGITRASGSEDSNDTDTDLGTFGIDKQQAEEFETLLTENDATAAVMVVDDHDPGRVTRSGFAFSSADSMPDAEMIADLIAGEASERNLLVSENRLVVEAFWN
jgi:hypothetical protein